MKLIIVISVWGNWHMQALLHKALPTLMHESNLPALARDIECTLLVHTKSDHMEELNRFLKPLYEHMKIEYVTPPSISTYKEGWAIAHKRGKELGCLVMFLAPDLIWAHGSFSHIGNLLKDGKKNIFMVHPRARPERFNGNVENAETLMKKAIDDGHPINASHDYESAKFSTQSEMVIFNVKNACVVRMFAREFFVCDPSEVGFTDQNLPDSIGSELHVVSSSDDAFSVSLAQETHDAHWRENEHRCTPEAIAEWVSRYPSPVNSWISHQPALWKYGEVDEEEIAAVIGKSGEFAARVNELVAGQ